MQPIDKEQHNDSIIIACFVGIINSAVGGYKHESPVVPYIGLARQSSV
jgi:hypothetical protein